MYDDTTGLPLAGAMATLVGSDANGKPYTALATSDDRGAYFLNASAGHGTLQIVRAGWTRVDRPIDVPGSQALQVFDARLTPVIGAAATVPAIVGGTVQAGDALLTIASGGLAGDAGLRVTTVGQQGLEGPLPVGWSPAGVVDVTPHGVDFTGPQALSMSNRLKLPAGTSAIVATWDESVSAWRAVGTTSIAGDGSRLNAAIVSSGHYAWLVADAVPSAPPAPASGALVDGVARRPMILQPFDHAAVKVLFTSRAIQSSVGLSLPLPSGSRCGHDRRVHTFTRRPGRPDPLSATCSSSAPSTVSTAPSQPSLP